MPVGVSDRPRLYGMDSDYAYSSAEDSYGAMGSEDEDFDFDSQAEMETHAKKVMFLRLWITHIVSCWNDKLLNCCTLRGTSSVVSKSVFSSTCRCRTSFLMRSS